MPPLAGPRRARPRHRAALLVPAVLLLAAGCGSSSGGGAAADPTVVPTPPVCTELGGILGNGPDPDADPIGYAEAQIGPLAGVHTTNGALQRAVTTLDRAFRHEFAAKASPASKLEVRAAQRQVNALCPGAAS
jgi:hypothetical protein